MAGKKRNPKNTLLNILIFLCTASMLICGALFVLPLLEYQAGDALYIELSRNTAAIPPPAPDHTQEDGTLQTPAPVPLPVPEPDYDVLRLENSEFYAWLYSEGTVINYPVTRGEDNRYYLNHLFNKKRNSMGTLFVDAGNAPDFADRNTIIYGHHMKNGSMFASLVGYKKQSYYDEHPDLFRSRLPPYIKWNCLRAM